MDTAFLSVLVFSGPLDKPTTNTGCTYVSHLPADHHGVALQAIQDSDAQETSSKPASEPSEGAVQ